MICQFDNYMGNLTIHIEKRCHKDMKKQSELML